MPEDIQNVIQRVLTGSHDLTDLEAIVAAIQNGRIVLVTGEGSVGVGGNVANSPIIPGSNNVTGSHNIVIYGSNAKVVREIIQDFTTQFNLLEQTRSRLAMIERLNPDEPLTQTQELELNVIKQQLRNDIEERIRFLEQDLEELHQRAGRLIEDVERSLGSKLKLLRQSGQKSLEQSSQVESLKQKINLVQEFKVNLRDSKEVADWLSQVQESYSKNAGLHALNLFPNIQNTASQQEIEDFYFSIEQFLEQISHCLLWGRANVLDAPGIPLVFKEIGLYAAAFSFIKERVKERPPSRIPRESLPQLEEYLDYLIQRLPDY
jgi:DNA repair exonuclease SbcCD ATPase subunit